MTQHIPVLLHEVLEHLNPEPGDCILDCTLGMGGHGVGISQKLGEKGHYIGLDRDQGSLNLARENMKEAPCRCTFVHEDFRNLDDVLKQLQIEKVDGILFDLGISSFQLDDPDRGFSLRVDGPLDMRMDRESFISAYDLINSLSEKEIALILKNFGEERWHNRIANYLVRERKRQPIASTQELCDMVVRAIPRGTQKYRLHPATRTFQAFRIAVNRELEAVDLALEKSVHHLRQGARIAVIAFHSLEDRIVKNKFRDFTRQGLTKLIFKKPLRPTDGEVEVNPRCRSALLRVAERTS